MNDGERVNRTYQDLPNDVIPTISQRPSEFSIINGPPKNSIDNEKIRIFENQPESA